MNTIIGTLLIPVVVCVCLVLHDYWGTHTPDCRRVAMPSIPAKRFSLRAFRILSQREQWAAVLSEGTFLARRRAGGNVVALYDLPGGLFCEVYFEAETRAMVRLSSFTGTAALERYTSSISLADLNEPQY
ncbi:hypothetical protein [Hymenobacter terricola]|uniref:hypothetical protein n=1 Tax=Hymenobacter terricola TaxID=2819236 RepID=UPI001B307B51|nr:hypothetical protein [Hymenobacter terricola]